MGAGRYVQKTAGPQIERLFSFMGRPSIYTPEIAAAICDEIAGGRSLRSICADEAMPSYSAVNSWLNKDLEFQQQYARAREDQADHYADEIIEIADSEAPADDRRVKIDARKWIASKLKAKAYGDKVAHTGPDGGAVQHQVSVKFVD